jgi:hypothetical protein
LLSDIPWIGHGLKLVVTGAWKMGKILTIFSLRDAVLSHVLT